MNEPKRRRWFQLHLSTVVVLSFVAAGLLWALLADISVAALILVAFAYGLEYFARRKRVSLE